MPGSVIFMGLQADWFRGDRRGRDTFTLKGEKKLKKRREKRIVETTKENGKLVESFQVHL